MSTTVLSQASHQWATRPDDESFDSIEALHDDAMRSRNQAVEREVASNVLRVREAEDDLLLTGPNGGGATLTNWSMGQLCVRANGMSQGNILKMKATTAALVLNEQLEALPTDDKTQLLFDKNGGLEVRAITTPSYARIWDTEITSRAVRLQEYGWNPAPESFPPSGESKPRRGLYRSDRDMFLFMVDNNRRIFEEEPGGGLSRGFMMGNSEVGSRKFWLTCFLYSYICGNHNIWGVTSVTNVDFRHVGRVAERIEEAYTRFSIEVSKWSSDTAKSDESAILELRRAEFKGTKAELLDMLFERLALSRVQINAAYDAAEKHESWYLAPPTSKWGIMQGVTEIAGLIAYQDKREELERVAAKIPAMKW